MLRTADFEARARQVLSKEAWEFYAEGADDEQTLRENVRAFSRYITLLCNYNTEPTSQQDTFCGPVCCAVCLV